LEGRGLDLSGLGQGQEAGSCENGNENFSSMKCRRNYLQLNKDFAP